MLFDKKKNSTEKIPFLDIKNAINGIEQYKALSSYPFIMDKYWINGNRNEVFSVTYSTPFKTNNYLLKTLVVGGAVSSGYTPQFSSYVRNDASSLVSISGKSTTGFNVTANNRIQVSVMYAAIGE